MNHLRRTRTILCTLYRYRLAELVASLVRPGRARIFLSVLPQSSRFRYETSAVHLRLTLENLGPIFIKLEQVLSTHPDLIPRNYAVELARLQDKVPPFDAQLSCSQIEKSLGQFINTLCAEFEIGPVASASIAQVHKAHPCSGEQATVEVLRLDLLPVIEQDLSLIRFGAGWVERLFSDGKRLKPHEVVAEFDKYLHDGSDLIREVTDASRLSRNLQNSNMPIMPRVFYDYCTNDVLTIEWMDGAPVSDITGLRANSIDLHKLANYGVEASFTQIFHDSFSYVDIHLDDILVIADNRYIALGFGIIGTLTNYDKCYLTINLLAFFSRDYHRVATTHIESGQVSTDTRAEKLEATVRAMCRPVFDKPISRASFGLVLMCLFKVSRRFNVEIQPQLVLLQKTLSSTEGLDHQFDPDLDLWKTAKPFLVKWMNEQVGPKTLWRSLKNGTLGWAQIIPSLLCKINALVDENRQQEMRDAYAHLVKVQQRQSL